VAHPQVQTVFFDSPRWPASRCTFATKAPALLVDRDVVFSAVLRPTELEGRGDGGAASSEDRNLDWTFFPQRRGTLSRLLVTLEDPSR